jgi:hypothetical protein
VKLMKRAEAGGHVRMAGVVPVAAPLRSVFHH